MNERMKEAIYDIIKSKYGFCREEGGCFIYEMSAFYDDKIDDKTAIKILEADMPLEEFWNILEEAYQEEKFRLEDELFDEIVEQLTTLDDGEILIEFEEEDEIKEVMHEYIAFEYPADHYLDQEFKVNIMLDTGDGNYDYSLNSIIYPCYYGEYNAYPDDKASIMWLAKQQGYGKRKFRKAMREGDISNPKGFLESVRQELANLPSHMATLTFLVEMKLRDLIELNRLIHLQDRNGIMYDARKNPYCGYIVLDKSTMTGLYNPWDGGGSVLEIELEKDVRLPIRFIRSALPDVRVHYEYPVGEVYGMCGSAWKDTLKVIHAPAEFAANN